MSSIRPFMRGILLLALLAGTSVAQQNPFEQLEGPRLEKKARPNAGEKERNKAPVADADEQLLTQLEADLDAAIQGVELLPGAVKKLTERFTKEFRENEAKLTIDGTDPETRRELINRQRVIAQYVIELERREQYSSNRGFGDQMQKVQAVIRDFQRANPKLARDERFRKLQREAPQRVMNNRRNRFGGRPESTTISAMLDRLSDGDMRRLLAEDEYTRAHPGEQQGAIQGRRHELRALLKLRWKQDRLVVDRDHWDEAFAGQSAEDISKEIDALLSDAGVPAPTDRELARMRGAQQGESNLLRLFHELRGGGRNGSYGRSGGPDSVNAHFDDGSLRARIKSEPNVLQFSVEEVASPYRILRVREASGVVEIVLLGDDLIHRFRQAADGSVKLTEIYQDEVIKHEADSFAKLYAAESRFVDDRFFALLDHLGIVLPVGRFDPVVVQQLLEALASNQNEVIAEVDRLVAELDAGRFSIRERAYGDLRVRIEEFYPYLALKQDDRTLSAEVRARIGKLLKTTERNGKVSAGSLVTAMQLTRDADYLDQVRDLVDEAGRQLIDRQLKQLLLE